MAASGQTAEFLPAPRGEQHFDQQDNRHADKHQLPVARGLVLIRVNHQLPDDRIQVQVEAGKDFAVDQQQRHARRRKNGGQEAHQPLRHDDKRQWEQDQQIGGEDQKAKVTNKTHPRVDAPG